MTSDQKHHGPQIEIVGPAGGAEQRPPKVAFWLWLAAGGGLALALVVGGFAWLPAKQPPAVPPLAMDAKSGATPVPGVTGAVVVAKTVNTNLSAMVTSLVASVVKPVVIVTPEPPRSGAIRVKVTAPEYASAFLAGASKRLRFETNDWQTVQSFPFTLPSISSGPCRIRLEVDGFSCSTLAGTNEIRTLVEPDRTKEVEFVLTPRPATLTVSCNVTNAQVQIGTRHLKLATPQSVPSLCPLKLAVSATGYVAQVINIGPLFPADAYHQVVKLDLVQNMTSPAVVSGGETSKPMTVNLGGGVKLEMVWIPPGSFMMGSQESEDVQRGSDEGPQHRVTLTKGFWMGKTEVMQAQWQQVMGSNPSHFKGENLPVEEVSWNDCQEFLKKMNSEVGIQKLEGGQFRLPTEAEWEYACRAGTSTKFNTGDEETDLGRAGWYSGNSDYGVHRVGQKEANAWGLHDMHGNVWEWCQDFWNGGRYGDGTVTDPTGPALGSDRVVRGGRWGISPSGCRSAHRGMFGPTYRDFAIGFRVGVFR